MTLFVFEQIADATESYHSHGGLVVIARDRAHADEQLAALRAAPNRWRTGESECPVVTEAEWGTVQEYALAGAPEPRVFVFPNAGCC